MPDTQLPDAGLRRTKESIAVSMMADILPASAIMVAVFAVVEVVGATGCNCSFFRGGAAMDLTIQIVHAKDFIRAIPDGELDVNTTSQMLLAAVSVTRVRGNHDVLVDCRQATGDISLADMTNVVESMSANRRLFHGKLAILTLEGETYSTLKFMETYAINRGFQVAAFTDYERAINWLMPATTIPPAS